ncbi:T9SS type A sorting domain-containing protein [Bacteroides cellulosilyticus]|jgi:hypothetical protein|uniref:T9SS type A sorting domain-containing protein n=1 Tax=Bacteroides cellulosilyticus TaxID=246787 RepID=UPI0018ACFE13|nr:T9SS type A sorting domain-containing protein [Bacteroides cellulosilyticus]
MRTLLFLLGSLLSLTGYAQSLNSTYNQPRSGDRLVKRMVTACEPGESGIGQVWNFSELKLHDVNYELKYVAQGVDTIIGTEHHTMYYYRISGDSLFCLGYENPTTFIAYQKPELLLTFPVFQGRVIADYFDGKGNYCEKLDIRLRGKSMVTADASGTLILPGGDTLRKVMRTYTHKFIHQKMTPGYNISDTLQLDTFAFRLDRDSIEYLLYNDSIRLETEIWRWYADGYRYPVFETVKSMIYKFGNAHEHFTTSFVYLPNEQYYDLPYDTDNQERREEIMDERRKREWRSTDENRKRNDNIDYRLEMDNDGDLQIIYNLKEAGKVSFALYDMQGRQLSAIQSANQSVGLYEKIIPMGKYSRGEYLLRIITERKIYGEKIVKH